MFEKINHFISDIFPILPGKNQLFQMTDIIDKEFDTEQVDFLWEKSYSRGYFNLLLLYKEPNGLKLKKSIYLF